MASEPASYKNDQACAVQAQMHIIDDRYVKTDWKKLQSVLMSAQFLLCY